MKYFVIATLFIFVASQGYAASCFVDLPGKSFEDEMGYRLITAADGTEFPAAEKAGFDKIASLLPEFFKNLVTLQTLERVPDGYFIDDGATGMFRLKTMSFGTQARYFGRIELCQAPLTIENDRFSGNFYLSAVHELSHAVDAAEGRMSLQADWQNVEASSGSQFITDYAATNSEEDFAESLAYFILQPDALLAKAPLKFKFISEQLFNGKRFDTVTLTASYQQALSKLSGSAKEQKISELAKRDYYACKILKAQGFIK